MGRRFAMLGVSALALLGGFVGGGAPAQAAPSAFLTLGAPTDPPRGFTEMCTHLAAVCRGFARPDFAALASPMVTPETRDSPWLARIAQSGTGTGALATEPPVSASSPIPADLSADRALLVRINNHVNGRVHQQSDMQTYGVPELWRPSGDGPHAVGDCEDLAIEKRIELIAAHFSADRLFFAVVYASGVGLHTVLVARLDSGDVVLDSRSAFIQPWSRTPYSWLSIEAPGAPLQWHQSA